MFVNYLRKMFTVNILLLTSSIGLADYSFNDRNRDLCLKDNNQYFIWKASKDSPSMLLPIVKGSAFKSINIYAEKLEEEHKKRDFSLLLKEPDFSSLINDPQIYNIKENLSSDNDNKKVKILVLANRFGHMLAGDKFPFVRQKLERYGAEVHVLPIRLDLILTTKRSRQDLIDFIISSYDALVLIGGADIEPRLFGASRSYFTGATFSSIDSFELEIASEWLIRGKGAIFGICRGHQILAAIHGANIVQDLEIESPRQTIHFSPKTSSSNLDESTSIESSWHNITLTDKKNYLYEAIGHTAFLVNSRHHQGVALKEGQILYGARVVSDVDDLIEVLEFSEGRGFSVQFHPEDMETFVGEKIMEQMVRVTESFSFKKHLN